MVLAACGGGGSGSTVVSSSATAQGLTQDNSSLLAGASLSGVTIFSDLIDLFFEDVDWSIAENTVGNIEACDVSGNTTSSSIIGSPLMAGNGVSIAFNNCVDGFVADRDRTNGSVELLISSFSGTFAPGGVFQKFEVITFSNIIIESIAGASQGEVITANGDLNLEISNSGLVETTQLSGPGFSFVLTDGSADTITINGLSDVRSTFNATDNSFSFEADFMLRLVTTGVDVTFTINTLVPFSGIVGSNPSAGLLTVTDSNGAVLTVSVLSSDMVQVSLDQNGDGNAESTQIFTFAQLEALAS